MRRFNEADACYLGFQMLLALEYIHGLNIVHRDVKAENFLFSAPGSIYNTPLKLIDFGMAVKKEDGQILHELCGSPHYLAPELIGQQYDHLVDLWALGVLLYLLMHGRYPYDAKDPQSLMIKILTEPIEYVNTKTKLSTQAVEFLNSILERDVRNRSDSKKAKRHPWMMTNLINLKPDLL